MKAAHGLGALAVLLLAGCGSSAEDRVYEAFKCSKVATLLEQERQGDIAFANAIPDMKQLEAEAGGGSPARFMMEMGERFQEDVPLYRLTVGGQMALLSEVYQSDECQALYTPDPGR